MDYKALIFVALLFPCLLHADFKLSGKWMYSENRSDNENGHFLAMTNDEKSSAYLTVLANPDISSCSPLIAVMDDGKKDYGEGEFEVDVELRVDSLGKWIAKEQTMAVSGSTVELYFIPDDDWTLVSEMMTGSVIRIKSNDWIGRFSLTGSKHAISEAISRCMDYSKRYGDEKYFEDSSPTSAPSDPDAKYF